MKFDFQLPTKIVFGYGTLKQMGKHIPSHIQRILIVTDPMSYERSGAKKIIEAQLRSYHVTVFDQVEENPSFHTIDKGSVMARDQKVQLIIGVGGGSPMDAAKAIAVGCHNQKPLMDYIQGLKLEERTVPVICIPTTAGTGSEVTSYAVITDKVNGKKLCLASPEIYPVCSIIDPQLTLSMPEDVCINTAMDVFTHAMEAYLSTLSFPLVDRLALEAMNLVLENMQGAIKKNKDAITKMSYASMLAGICISQTSTILLHIMAYPLSVFHHIPHGRANAILMPAFLDFMKQRSTVPDKMENIEEFLKPHGSAKNFVNDLGISTQLTTYGVHPENFEDYAKETIVKDDIGITPADVRIADIVAIYENSC